MKYSKKLRVLNCETGIRIKLNWTQVRLAQYLGVSKSLISMIENGHRHLPMPAVKRLWELQADIEALEKSGDLIPVEQVESLELAQLESKIAGRKKINRSRVKELEYRLQQMTDRHDSIVLSLQLTHSLMQSAGKLHPQAINALKIQHYELCKKLKACHPSAISQLEGRLAMYKIMVAGGRSLRMEAVHSSLDAPMLETKVKAVA